MKDLTNLDTIVSNFYISNVYIYCSDIPEVIPIIVQALSVEQDADTRNAFKQTPMQPSLFSSPPKFLNGYIDISPLS